jgi:hypothetical protein
MWLNGHGGARNIGQQQPQQQPQQPQQHAQQPQAQQPQVQQQGQPGQGASAGANSISVGVFPGAGAGPVAHSAEQGLYASYDQGNALGLNSLVSGSLFLYCEIGDVCHVRFEHVAAQN